MRKRICAVVIGTVAALAATACAPGSPASSGDRPTTPTKIDWKSFEGKKLTYVYFTDGAADEKATRSAISRFESETGAKVNLQIVPYANLDTSLQARLSSGQAPEVARVSDWHAYASVAVDFKQYFGDGYPGQFTSGAAKTAQDTSGHMLAVPSDLTVNGPFVNVDAFEKAGVAIPAKWTWDQFVADAEKVAKANHMPYAIAIDKSGHRLSTVLSQFGTVLVGPGNKNGLDGPKAEKALAFFTGLVKNNTISKDFWLGAGDNYAGGNDQFLAGQAPVYLSGPWQVGAFTESAGFAWAATPNPCEARCGGFPGGKYMVAFKNSGEPALAAAFVEWMNTADNQRAVDRTAYWLPTRRDLTASGVQYPSHSADMNTFLKDLARTPDDTFTSNSSPAFTKSAQALITETDKVVAGQEDVKSAVGNLKTAIDAAAR
ncbi:ABC transporter substrate-binding protein [Streptomyces sp. NPDC058683]|uniref:ABC transporter substrate-binding protein n=1 Tax=Streptomyces sp. NPDC058683 TaxID=3346597 RepID=UPI0036550EC1